MDFDSRFIVIEGIDGAGKTMVSNYLSERYDQCYMTQPEDSWVGEAARKALEEDVEPSCDLFLHMAAHANQQARLKPQLEKSGVVMDRYYHSRVAYQAVQTQFSAREIEEMHLDWSLQPSETIILDLPPETALERKGGSQDKFEKIDFLSDVRSVYRDFFEDRDDVTFVDARNSEEEVIRIVELEIFG
ncbi:dTMP kinase [Natrinema sp. H-ect4]|uniref:dTMP kinase n=1 Tax=Natrinema sp. H-ect4 TaxID=3242699 RepID=UPI0035A8CF37